MLLWLVALQSIYTVHTLIRLYIASPFRRWLCVCSTIFGRVRWCANFAAVFSVFVLLFARIRALTHCQISALSRSFSVSQRLLGTRVWVRVWQYSFGALWACVRARLCICMWTWRTVSWWLVCIFVRLCRYTHTSIRARVPLSNSKHYTK